MANKYNDAESNREKLKKATTEEELNELLMELGREWKETEEKYSPTPVEELFPEDHGFTFKEYKAESDDAIAKRAESELKPASEGKKAQLRADEEGKEREIESERTAAKADNDSQKRSIEKEKEKEIADIENETVAQGIGRSSIKSGLEGEAESAAVAAAKSSDAQLALKEAEMDAEIATLREKLDAALQAEDADAAADIAKRTADLISARDKEVNRVTEYKTSTTITRCARGCSDKRSPTTTTAPPRKPSMSASTVTPAKNRRIIPKGSISRSISTRNSIPKRRSK